MGLLGAAGVMGDRGMGEEWVIVAGFSGFEVTWMAGDGCKGGCGRRV